MVRCAWRQHTLYQFSQIQQHIQTPKPRPYLSKDDSPNRLYNYELRIGITDGGFG
ncbi:hypothetical protein I8748_17660 [Nostoc sp. CENA67]|uniref:Uncharacterized protein n=1 Tax=Amazonocrinis nigriterrae CENA67 TaxID=2794033 RepID=A0A8J7HUT4_9NOST|nr:hypothetical protein [Amazonocrinis nigriterrae]MBH8563988.1 hypothetical protein [Amazonocrinis nigriterrae CENA67]